MDVLGWHKGWQGVKWKNLQCWCITQHLWVWEEDSELGRKSRGRRRWKKTRESWVSKKQLESFLYYLSSMRSCAKMSFPGQWMDLQMSPIISTSNQELSSSWTWSCRDSRRKPGQTHPRLFEMEAKFKEENGADMFGIIVHQSASAVKPTHNN